MSSFEQKTLITSVYHSKSTPIPRFRMTLYFVVLGYKTLPHVCFTISLFHIEFSHKSRDHVGMLNSGDIFQDNKPEILRHSAFYK